MRFSSFKPNYLIARVAQFHYQRVHPNAPWLTPSAIMALQGLLKPTDEGFEFGSGRSTRWIARRVKFIHSVEHDGIWHAAVSEQLKKDGLSDKVDYQFGPERDGSVDQAPEGHPYIAGIAATTDNSLDFVLVDGIFRYTCTKFALRKLKPGGLLILDNANRYFPNRFEEGHSTVHDYLSEPLDERWSELWDILRSWRGFNTTDGLSDTRFWLKPCG